MRWWPFRRRTEKRTITYQDLWGSGRDTPWRSGGIDAALTLVPVFAATRLLADSVASLPLQTFRQVDDVRLRVADPQLIADPTGYGTVYDWVHRAVTSLALRGNAFGLITDVARDGTPVRIEWLHPDEVTLETDRTDTPPVWYWQGRRVDSSMILHVPGYTLPGRVLGMSPIKAYRLTVETGLGAQQFGRDWFAGGSTPAGVLETDQVLNEEQAEAVKRRFKQAASGRDTVVLGAGTTYKPISVPADESQFLATMRATAGQIASIYGIPPEMIGGESGNSLTYANTEQQAINFVTYTLRPWLVRLEQALTRLLPAEQFVRFNIDSIIRADLKTRYEAHHYALADGWLSRDEVRLLENRAPLPGGEGAKYPPLMAQPARIPPGGTQ